jgi:hypothetical protein
VCNASVTPLPAVIIKEPDLRYEGNTFKDFLERFIPVAEIYSAGSYNKALQVCRFVKVEELKKELESMNSTTGHFFVQA